MRSKWKIKYKINEIRRGEIITKEDIGKKVGISDGKNIRKITILPGHINYKCGARVLTKKAPKYKKK